MSTYDFTDEYYEISGGQGTSCIAEVTGYLTLDIEDRTYDYPGSIDVVDTEVTSCTISLYWRDEQGMHELFMDEDNSDFETRYGVLEAWGITDSLCDMEIDYAGIDDEPDYYEPSELDEWMDYDPDC